MGKSLEGFTLIMSRIAWMVKWSKGMRFNLVGLCDRSKISVGNCDESEDPSCCSPR